MTYIVCFAFYESADEYAGVWVIGNVFVWFIVGACVAVYRVADKTFRIPELGKGDGRGGRKERRGAAGIYLWPLDVARTCELTCCN